MRASIQFALNQILQAHALQTSGDPASEVALRKFEKRVNVVSIFLRPVVISGNTPNASYRLVRDSGTFAISPGLMEARTAKQAGTCGNSSCKAIDFVRKMTTAILRPAR